MNVLVLTPDAVGSTLLQRLITVYMQLQNFSKPIINLHELTNGLESYYSDIFNQTVLGKPDDRSYHQSLEQIQNLLASVDHFKTSRLAKYHIDRRNDHIDLQIPFYHYLNQNFFIIATRRRNIFEHAISWCINSFTKKLNVYDPGEKIRTFIDLYRDPINIEITLFVKHLDEYKNYVDWSTRYFNVGSFFCYEDHVHNLENYILNLPIFLGQTKIGWADKFGISFQDWNIFHHLTSDLESIAHDNLKTLELPNYSNKNYAISWLSDNNKIESLTSEYQQVKDSSWPEVRSWQDFDNLPDRIKDECIHTHQLQSIKNKQLENIVAERLDHNSKIFLQNNKNQYFEAVNTINHMQTLGILIGGLPIKKQTMAGKKAAIKNWRECVSVYNAWISNNSDLGSPITNDEEDRLIQIENQLWKPGANQSTDLLSN
jgi:hypothetical protein